MNQGSSSWAKATVLGLGLIAAGMASGCQTLTPPADPPSAVSDPCAERLHDLCGLLLLHQAAHGRFPEKISDLDGTAAPDQKKLLECPVTGKPYLYDRSGIAVPNPSGKVILRDPSPHSGITWAIAIVGSNPSQPLNTRVIAIVMIKER